MSEQVALSSIRADIQAQPRATINTEIVGEYAEAMALGAEFPPMVVFRESDLHWLADGFHRFYAARGAERETFPCDVREGGLRDAILFSVGTNAAHGIRRTNEDKRRAIQKLLDDAEWSHWSDREIARRCGVDNKTVSALRPAPSEELPQIEQPRTVSRGGTVYTQNTASIGRRFQDDSAPTRPAADWSPRDIRPAPATQPAPAAPVLQGDRAVSDALQDIVSHFDRLPPPEMAFRLFPDRHRHLFDRASFVAVADWFARFAELWPDEGARNVAAE